MSEEEFTDVFNCALLSVVVRTLRDCDFQEGTRNCCDWKVSLAILQRLQQRLTTEVDIREQA